MICKVDKEKFLVFKKLFSYKRSIKNKNEMNIVKDRSIIKTTADETKTLEPEGLQDAIDVVVVSIICI